MQRDVHLFAFHRLIGPRDGIGWIVNVPDAVQGVGLKGTVDIGLRHGCIVIIGETFPRQHGQAVGVVLVRPDCITGRF